ncbi:MAG: family 78 glycoside hydrolase catalytic domain [Saprospiraceae bacterium]|nr:family 78 glycoside hydrolase catalytic domain [Saprospiraceae bacterium]
MRRYSDCFLLLVSFLLAADVFCASLSVEYLRCEYLVEPLAVHEPAPRLSWIVTSDGQSVKQEAFQILVSSSAELLDQDMGDLWDSQEVPGYQNSQVAYRGRPLGSRQECYWKVRVWDSDGKSSEWSEVATWRMGLLLDSDWEAHWIGFDNRALNKNQDLFLPPSPYFRKDVEVKKLVERATLYTTALGVYEASINGQKVGEDFLAPGWTNYQERVYYQTNDVTAMLQQGQNTLGMVVASGWYAGYLGYSVLVRHPKEYAFYGEIPVIRSQLEVEYADGSSEVFGTDSDWKANTGPMLEADILMGETYDARAEFGSWDQPGFDDREWKIARRMVGAMGVVESSPGVPLRVIEELTPVEVTEPEDSKYIFDFGTNFAGVIRLKTKGTRGTKLTFRYGEMLHPDGRIMTENLRKARATDSYILKGDEAGEIWTPKFTYHGFQFVEVSGLKERPGPGILTGLVISSATPRTGQISTGNDMVNQLYQNIVRTQLANYFDIPTDCPQRDERMGWTGDAQVYIRAASFNHDVAAFHQKWIQALNDDQIGNGAYPNFAPFPFHRPNTVFSPAWMDAGIICPYVVYRVYGDIRILKRFYPNMKELIRLYQSKSQDNLLPEGAFDEVQPAGGYGDWLNQDNIATSKEYLANSYWLYDLHLMQEIATALGKEEDALEYATIHRSVRNAFVGRYLQDGKMVEPTQTACATALSLDLLPSEYRATVGEQLVQLIEANSGYLQTGFIGTKHLLEALSKTGHDQVALKLFTNKGFPSWLYEVVNGATSIWERWDSYTIEDGFGGVQNTGMNSFSHYAFGAVSEWMFRYLAGIDMAEVGYRKIKICPTPNEQLSPLTASYYSVMGEIKSGWSIAGENLIMEVTIPANATAEVWIPANAPSSVTQNGKDLAIVESIQDADFIEGKVRLEVGSGTYRFISKNAKNLLSRF